jgi:hypothetical protein
MDGWVGAFEVGCAMLIGDVLTLEGEVHFCFRHRGRMYVCVVILLRQVGEAS